MMVQQRSVTCRALGLHYPELMLPFDCNDSCWTVRGPQEPAWLRGICPALCVCDVSLTLCLCLAATGRDICARMCVN